MPTNLLIGRYTILAVASYTLFGLGLAFYATPSTDAALSNLPDDQAGSGSGIYKMASSLGASFGVAISAAIFTALSADRESTRWLEGVITFAGRQDNLAVRQAALVALAFNLLMRDQCRRAVDRGNPVASSLEVARQSTLAAPDIERAARCWRKQQEKPVSMKTPVAVMSRLSRPGDPVSRLGLPCVSQSHNYAVQ